MASSTELISSIYIPLLSAVFALVGGVFGGLVVWKLDDNNERYKKLYGPLKFHLLMMKLMVANKEDVYKDIKDWYSSAELRVNMMQKHMTPLTKQWINHKDDIKKLFEENPGLVKKDDFGLMSDFMDGCVKREITEDGKNDFTENNRVDKLLKAIENLQSKLLK
jgi:hypothetical protein